MTFIKNDLSYVPKDRFVVFCQHIPLVHTENIEDLKTLLSGRNKLFALSGHTHRVSRHFIPIGNAVMQELVAVLLADIGGSERKTGSEFRRL